MWHETMQLPCLEATTAANVALSPSVPPFPLPTLLELSCENYQLSDKNNHILFTIRLITEAIYSYQLVHHIRSHGIGHGDLAIG